MKKIIFIFIGGYLPSQKYGGPVTSIVNLIDNLKHKYNFYIVSNNHDLDDTKILQNIHPDWNTVRDAKVLYISESEYSTSNFLDIMSEFEVSMVYLSSVLYYQMNVPAISAAKKRGIPILLAPRGEICKSALELHKLKKSAYLFLIKISGFFNKLYFHATSGEEKESVKSIFKTPENKIFLLPNFHGLRKDKLLYEKKKGNLKIIFISRIQRKKNLLFAIDVVSRLSGNVVFDIYGPIEQTDYWEECKLAISESANNVSINYCGALNPEEAKDIFKHYDCFLFPTLSENYGHVIAEAVLSGCPCVISKGTTPWDDIHNSGGYAISLINRDEYISRLNTLVDMSSDSYAKLSKETHFYAERKLNTEKLINKYDSMFEKVIGNN